jgi:hypothetical protein
MGKHAPESLRSARCPFKEDLKINVFIRGKLENRIDPANIKQADGIVVGVGNIDKVYKSWILEQDKRVEVYLTNAGKSLDEYYDKLNKEGSYLFEYIKRNCLREDTLYFNMEYDEYAEVTKTKSRTSYWSAKKNLIDSGFIAETSYRGWYWINPKLTFRGNRYKCAELKDNVNIVSKKEE